MATIFCANKTAVPKLLSSKYKVKLQQVFTKTKKSTHKTCFHLPEMRSFRDDHDKNWIETRFEMFSCFVCFLCIFLNLSASFICSKHIFPFWFRMGIKQVPPKGIFYKILMCMLVYTFLILSHLGIRRTTSESNQIYQC